MTGPEFKQYARAHWGPVLAAISFGTAVLTFLALATGAWSQAGLPIPASRAFVQDKISQHIEEHARQIAPMQRSLGGLEQRMVRTELTTLDSKESTLRGERLNLQLRLRELDASSAPGSAETRRLIETRILSIDISLQRLGEDRSKVLDDLNAIRRRSIN